MFALQCCLLVIGVILSSLLSSFYVILAPPSLPDVNPDAWWGNTNRSLAQPDIREFKINVSKEIIEDLNYRLKHSRILAPYFENSANKYGTNQLVLNEIVDFWHTRYNWTERQDFLNRYPQFLVNIQVEYHLFFDRIGFDRKLSKTTPILLVHGWPGSVREFYELIEILEANKKFNLELIAPSLPGFGFSEKPGKPGFGLVQAAIIFKKLMTRLGHHQFYIQGGDIGSITLHILSVLYPESVLGFHTNFPLVYTSQSYIKQTLGWIWPSRFLKLEHYDRVYPLTEKGRFIFQESGYLHLQSTKPDSIGPALDDSPLGLAAYHVEKFITGANFTWISKYEQGNLQAVFSCTSLIDNLMYYWITGSATSAFRIYYETFSKTLWSDTFTILRIPVKVPTVILRSKYDLYMADGVLKEIFPKLLHLTDRDTGHFAAFQEPQLVAQDLLKAIKIFQSYNLALKETSDTCCL